MRTIETVTGPLDAAATGKILIHEHIICVSSSISHAFGERWFSREAVIETAVDRLRRAKAAGLGLLVDATPVSLGRDPELLREVSLRSGVPIALSTGFYHFDEFGLNQLPPEEMAKYLIEEIREGVVNTNIRPALLKCAIETPGKGHRSVEVAAVAAAATGTPVYVHTNSRQETGREALEILKGVDPARIAIGHIADLHYARRVLEHGCYAAFDRLFPKHWESETAIVAELLREGWGERILLSHDFICHDITMHNLRSQETPSRHRAPEGITVVFDTVIPALRGMGVAEEQLRLLTEENPRRFLTYERAI